MHGAGVGFYEHREACLDYKIRVFAGAIKIGNIGVARNFFEKTALFSRKNQPVRQLLNLSAYHRNISPMVSDRPKAVKPDTQTPTPLPLLLLVAAILLLVIAAVLKTGLNGEDKTPKLSPQEEEKLQKRLKEIDEAEQYALIANEDGWYPCNHPGRATFYLKAGEVWKYGATTKGQFGRYSIKYLARIKVSYIVQLYPAESGLRKTRNAGSSDDCEPISYFIEPDKVIR